MRVKVIQWRIFGVETVKLRSTRSTYMVDSVVETTRKECR